MSFQVNWGSSTRQDHLTFMNGAQPSRSKDPGYQRKPITVPANSALPPSGTAHVSYAIGGATTSPQRLATSASIPLPGPSTGAIPRSATEQLEFASGSAAEHHARLKQRNESRITSVRPPIVKDTTINIATAFHQAATDKMAGPPSSSSIRLTQRHPSEDRRGLSRPPEPGSRNREARSHASITEDDESNVSRSFQRAKSPMEALGAAAAATVRGIAPVVSAVFLREPSAVPAPKPTSRTGSRVTTHDTSATLNVTGESYDYAQEEDLLRDFDAIPTQSTLVANGSFSQKRKPGPQRKMNEDNRAYQPPPEHSDTEEESDGGTRRRRKSGPSLRLTGLPTVGGPSKRRTKRKKDPTGDERENSQDGSSFQRAGSSNANRTSRPPSAPPSKQHDLEDLHSDNDNELRHSDNGNYSDIQEIPPPTYPSAGIAPTSEEDSYEDDGKIKTVPTFGIGARMGSAVHYAGASLGALLLLALKTAFAVFQVVVARPWSFGTDVVHNSRKLFKSARAPYLLMVSVVLLAIFFANQGLFSSTLSDRHPTRSWGIPWPFISKRPPVYSQPDVPPGSLQELIGRLTQLESAFFNLEAEHQRTLREHAQTVKVADNESRAREALAVRLGIAETKLEKETRRAMLAEDQYSALAQKNIDGVQHAVQDLNSEVKSVRSSLVHLPSTTQSVDIKTQERLRHLESQLKDVVTEIKASGGKREKTPVLTNKGQDISSIVSNFLYKDVIARPDYAMYYSGGRAAPHLTSKPVVVPRPGAWFFRKTSIQGRPPVTALTPDISVGNCWSYPGAQGQIGIVLSEVIYLTHISIDHPPREILLDRTTAPRQFSAWILIDTEPNQAKADAWEKELEEQRARNIKEGKPVPELPPKPFGRHRLLHFGTFEYDVHSESHVQTFEIPPMIQALGIDIKAMVVQFHTNWGNSQSSCVYRIRAHGSKAIP